MGNQSRSKNLDTIYKTIIIYYALNVILAIVINQLRAYMSHRKRPGW